MACCARGGVRAVEGTPPPPAELSARMSAQDWREEITPWGEGRFRRALGLVRLLNLPPEAAEGVTAHEGTDEPKLASARIQLNARPSKGMGSAMSVSWLQSERVGSTFLANLRRRCSVKLSRRLMVQSFRSMERARRGRRSVRPARLPDVRLRREASGRPCGPGQGGVGRPAPNARPSVGPRSGDPRPTRGAESVVRRPASDTFSLESGSVGRSLRNRRVDGS